MNSEISQIIYNLTGEFFKLVSTSLDGYSVKKLANMVDFDQLNDQVAELTEDYINSKTDEDVRKNLEHDLKQLDFHRIYYPFAKSSNLFETRLQLETNNLKFWKQVLEEYVSDTYPIVRMEYKSTSEYKQATERINDWITNGDASKELNLSDLKLRWIPPLPTNLEKLHINGCKSDYKLPTRLCELWIDGNKCY